MSEAKTNELAEKIALLLQTETPTNDFTVLQLSLEKINQRLDKIELQIFSHNTHSAIQVPPMRHPSQQKFEIAEAVAFDLAEQFETEKACPFEPTGKPCDHCAMCSSRGF
jgi:hypothetical protein